MEKNEKRQKAINEMNWRKIKKEFDEFETYPEKLAWWEQNTPYNGFKHFKYNFFYSEDGSPLIENPFPVTIYGNTPVIQLDKIPDFITVIPDLNNLTDKQSFWNWLLKIKGIGNLTELEFYYSEKFSKSDKMNFDLMIEDFNKDIKDEFENGKLASEEFLDGRSFAIHTDFSFLFKNYSNWNITTTGENNIIQELHYTLKGYQNRLKEIALNKVINGLNDKPEIIEDIPNPNKIKWLGTPSQFSYLFLELVRKGFIEQPLYRGETSPSRYAELCFNNFDIETTINSLKTEFKNNSSLSETYRSKFTIPEKTESTDKRSGKNKK